MACLFGCSGCVPWVRALSCNSFSGLRWLGLISGPTGTLFPHFFLVVCVFETRDIGTLSDLFPAITCMSSSDCGFGCFSCFYLDATSSCSITPKVQYSIPHTEKAAEQPIPELDDKAMEEADKAMEADDLKKSDWCQSEKKMSGNCGRGQGLCFERGASSHRYVMQISRWEWWWSVFCWILRLWKLVCLDKSDNLDIFWLILINPSVEQSQPLWPMPGVPSPDYHPLESS